MRSLRSLLLAVALPVLVLAGTAACGDQGSTATGVVLSIDSSGGTIRGFTLRTADGATLTLTIGTLETGGDTFPASHLVVHAVSADPVSVWYRATGGQNVVFRLTDAPSSSAAASPSGATTSPSAGTAGPSPSATAGPSGSSSAP